MKRGKKKTRDINNLTPKSSDTIPPPPPRHSEPPPQLQQYFHGQRVQWRNYFGRLTYGRVLSMEGTSLIMVEADNGTTDVLPPTRVAPASTGFYNIR